MSKLLGKVALVTGAASGIGRAVAQRFHAEGAKVLLFDRDGEGLKDTARSIEKDVDISCGDVTDEDAVRDVVAYAIRHHGRLDVLSHNAGIDQSVLPTVELTLSLWNEVMAVNAGGTFLVNREAIRAMRQGGGGVIVNTVSDLGYVVVPGLSAYCSSKGAALQLTRALAAEYGPAIRVNALCPTMVDTPMARRSLSSRSDPEAYLAQISAEIPMQRIATVGDVAGAAAFLASDDSCYITGAALVIDGGRTVM